MLKENRLSKNKLERLYTIPIDQLNNKNLEILDSAIDDNKLKTSVESFFERNPEYAAHYIRKYKEYVKGKCPNINKPSNQHANKTTNKNNRKTNNNAGNNVGNNAGNNVGNNVGNNEGNNAGNNFLNNQEGGKRKYKKTKRSSNKKRTSLKKSKTSRKKTKKSSSKMIKGAVRTGPRGGKYILLKGRKKYL